MQQTVTDSIHDYMNTFSATKSRVKLNKIVSSSCIDFNRPYQTPSITDFYMYFDDQTQMRFEYKSTHTGTRHLNIMEIDRILGCEYNYYLNINKNTENDDIQFDIWFFDNKNGDVIAKMFFTVSYCDFTILQSFTTLDEFISYYQNDTCLDIEFLTDISKQNYKNTIEKYHNYNNIMCAQLWFHIFEYCCEYFAPILIQRNN